MIIDIIFIRRPRYLANESFQDTNVKRGHLDTEKVVGMCIKTNAQHPENFVVNVKTSCQ